MGNEKTVWVVRVLLNLDDGVKVISEVEYDDKQEALTAMRAALDPSEPRHMVACFAKTVRQ